MRSAIVVACLLLGTCAPAAAQVSIGISLRAYPDLVAVPGYPVYYAPQVDSNFFFYDGLYWVYAQDRWYSGAWYDGPWEAVAPGASTGVAPGNSAAADGTAGTAPLSPRPPRCRRTSASIRGRAIRARISN